jgi:hypothetical protein
MSWVDLRPTASCGATVPGGRPSAEPGTERASGAALRGAALDLKAAQFGNIECRHGAWCDTRAPVVSEGVSQKASAKSHSSQNLYLDLPFPGCSRNKTAHCGRAGATGVKLERHDSLCRAQKDASKEPNKEPTESDPGRRPATPSENHRR